MQNYLLENSKIISWLRILFSRLYYFENQIDKICKNSRTYSLIYSSYYRIKTYFRYSFIRKIIDVDEGLSFPFLNNSKVAQRIVSVYTEWSNNHVKTSAIMSIFRKIKKELYFLPGKIVGIVIVIAIVTNVFLAILLKIEFSPFGWLIRGLIFFAGIIGIFCNADWQTISSDSKILRRKL